jgi:hypothetical protein
MYITTITTKTKDNKMIQSENDIPTMEKENNSDIIQILCVHLNQSTL